MKRLLLYAALALPALPASASCGAAFCSLNTNWDVQGAVTEPGLRADLRYSRFNSAFAQGSYKTFSLSRSFGEGIQGEVQVGTQSFVSPFSQDNGARFVNTRADVNLGARYFLEGGFTLSRGVVQDYTQWHVMLGYRFDNRKREGIDHAKP